MLLLPPSLRERHQGGSPIDVETDTVQKKAKAATEWCERASAVSDRQWKYVLLSHDSILINRTFASLVQH